MQNLKIKRGKRVKIFWGILLLGFILITNLFPFATSAQTPTQQNNLEYTLLAPLPCVGEGQKCDVQAQKTQLTDYIPGLFKLAIGLSAAAAVVMIVVGGFQYMTSDAIQGKSAGRERVKNAISSLVLVIGAWLILNEINPKLLNISLNIDSVNIKGVSGGSFVAGNLQSATQDALIGLAAQCTGCTITQTSTTGDTHNVNSLHYQGLAVDIAPNAQLTQYLTGSTAAPKSCQVITKTLSGVSSRFLWEPQGATCGGTVPSSGDHWHMSVTP